jgi:hypothetical protein
MGSAEERKQFLTMVEKACRIARQLRDIGIRPTGLVRIDSATGVHDWAVHPGENQKAIAKTFSEACDIAEQYGERLAAEGEICWGGMHSWKHMVQLLEMVGRPKTLGFQADMAHTMLYTMGYNAAEHRILPKDYDWKDRKTLDGARSTASTHRSSGTCTICIACNISTTAIRGSCAAGDLCTSPTAIIRIWLTGGCRVSRSDTSTPSFTRSRISSKASPLANPRRRRSGTDSRPTR